MNEIFNGAFSLGTSQRSKWFIEDTIKYPGPGTYGLPKLINKPNQQNTRFQKSTRNINYNNGIPGPGSYKNKYSQIDGKIEYRFGCKHKSIFKHQEIGPGSYEPKLKNESNFFSFGYRFPSAVKTDTPGPNAYNEDAPGKRSEQSSSLNNYEFGNAKRLSYRSEDVPGPGEYRPTNSTPNIGFKFGNSKRKWMEEYDNPGPGTFNTNNSLLNKSGFSMGLKEENSLKLYDNKVPGPGTYDGMYERSSEGTKIGKEKKYDMVDKESLLKPAPNVYHPILQNIKQSTNNTTISSSKRPALSENKNNPGPGNYENIISYFSGPKWKIGKKITFKKNNQAPGPGSYEEIFAKAERKYDITAGKRSGNENLLNNNLGPGTYNIEGEVCNNKFTNFYSSRFDSNRSIFDPGPGSYDISGKIGKIPDYLLKNESFNSREI